MFNDPVDRLWPPKSQPRANETGLNRMGRDDDDDEKSSNLRRRTVAHPNRLESPRHPSWWKSLDEIQSDEPCFYLFTFLFNFNTAIYFAFKYRVDTLVWNVCLLVRNLKSIYIYSVFYVLRKVIWAKQKKGRKMGKILYIVGEYISIVQSIPNPSHWQTGSNLDRNYRHDGWYSTALRNVFLRLCSSGHLYLWEKNSASMKFSCHNVFSRHQFQMKLAHGVVNERAPIE